MSRRRREAYRVGGWHHLDRGGGNLVGGRGVLFNAGDGFVSGVMGAARGQSRGGGLRVGLWLWSRSDARRRIGALIGLALLIALVGGASLAALAGARRSATRPARPHRSGAPQASDAGEPLAHPLTGVSRACSSD